MDMRNEKMSKKKIFVIFAIVLAALVIFLAVNTIGREPEVKYCCEKTTYGAWCQDAPEDQCDPDYRKTPTSCEATSYCKLGCCYDSTEGTCMERTSQKVCDDAGGTWSDSPNCNIPQCDLGCCLLGDQASFVTLTRCKKMSSDYGLETSFRRDIDNEQECIALAAESDKGACVFEVDYQRTCEFTTRQECNNRAEGQQADDGTVTSEISFYNGLLCSNPELATDCGPTEQTTCYEDKVHFVDSCGNIANIYDADKIDDEEGYWGGWISPDESCGAGEDVADSTICGNCNYFQGSTCKNYQEVEGAPRPKYGDKICADLDCPPSELTGGEERMHGESWCTIDGEIYEDNPERDRVGSRYYRHVCMNNEVIIEPCADYRQEVCIEDTVGDFKMAGCRVNRWEDCFEQTTEDACTNRDQRACKWIGDDYRWPSGECVPEHHPGLEFWRGGTAGDVCSLGDNQYVITTETDGWLIERGESDDERSGWEDEQIEVCDLIADCGARDNWIGKPGYGDGYETERDDM